MDTYLIPTISQALQGEVQISGAKNAVLAVMAATLLADGISEITNVPHLKDMKTMSDVLRVIGCRVDGGPHTLRIDTRGANHLEAPYELVKTMRASFYVLGPLMARFGRCRVSLPGGCAWGPRPVDLHLKGMEAMGMNISLEKGYVIAKSPQRVKGGVYKLEPSSVGATVNLLLAAVLKAEKFTIKNAAREPDVVQLCNFLVAMGADIQGIGSDVLTIRAVNELRGVEVNNDPDRIELGTFMIAGAMHKDSELTLTQCKPEHLGH